MTTTKQTRVAVIYKRDSSPDQDLVGFIEQQLAEQGCEVFIDRYLTMGVDWAREIEARIRSADAVVPLLSADSITVKCWRSKSKARTKPRNFSAGRPRLLPVRVNYTGPLPEPLASILDPIQYFPWEGEHDNLGLATELMEAIRHLPQAEADGEPQTDEAAAAAAAPAAPLQEKPRAAAANRPAALESIGGAVPLNSEFYVARPVDGELQSSISKRDSIILIKGARQMGKTSLLARGLQYAREQGSKAFFDRFAEVQRRQPPLGAKSVFGDVRVDCRSTRPRRGPGAALGRPPRTERQL